MRIDDWLTRIENGDVPHAILFAGPKESGQLQLARRAAARFLLHRDDPDALADCPFYTEPENYAIDTVRDALALINAEAYGRGRRCILLAEAQTMSEAAQDVLLKTLEEPPTDTLLLLTGTESGLRPTILSRCMILRAETEPWERIAERLERKGTEKALAERAAKLSDGIAGRAKAFLSESNQTFRKGAIDCIGACLKRAKPYAALQTLCTDTVAEEDADGTVKRSKKVSAERLDAFLEVFLSILTDVLRMKCGFTGVRNTDCTDLERNFDATFTIAQIQSMIQIASDAKEMLAYKASAALTADWFLAKLP